MMNAPRCRVRRWKSSEIRVVKEIGGGENRQ
jgi:hypothetical protein